MITCSSKPDIPLHEFSYPWVGALHQDECKDCSPEQLKKERMKRNLKALRYTRKRTLYARRQLGGEPPMHNKSVVKTLYNRYIVSEWLLRSSGWWISKSMTNSHDSGRSTTWICSSLSLAMMLWASKKQKSWIQLWYTVMIRFIWSLQRKSVFQKDQSTLRSSITFSLMKSRKEKWFSNIYLHRWADKHIFW